jgi:TolB-like protein
MKKVMVAVVVAVCGAGVFAQQLTVAVSPFEVRAGFTKDEAEVVFELFVSELVGTGSVKVVDRNSFDAIMEQMKFQITDWSDSAKVAQLGQALNANSIIRCVVMKMGEQLIMTANILDINTAQILSSSNIRMKNIDEIFTQLSPFVKQLVAKLPKPPPPPPRSIVGKWRDSTGGMTLEFNSNGTFLVNRVYTFDNGRKTYLRTIGTYKQNAVYLALDYNENSKGYTKGNLGYTFSQGKNRSDDRLTLDNFYPKEPYVSYTRFVRAD